MWNVEEPGGGREQLWYPGNKRSYTNKGSELLTMMIMTPVLLVMMLMMVSTFVVFLHFISF